MKAYSTKGDEEMAGTTVMIATPLDYKEKNKNVDKMLIT